MQVHVIDIDVELEAMMRDALADVGCLDLDTADVPDANATLSVICVRGGNLATVQRHLAAAPEVPVVVVCDERDVDLVLATGVSQCIVRPVRRGELVARLRTAVRDETAPAIRERKLSRTIELLRREKEDLERLVCVDALTGIANRRHAMELLAGEWRRAAREHAPLAVVMIDLDCFHGFNEQYGHLGGDACLQQVVAAMARCLRRPSDFLGRYGGEEFIAVLPNTDAAGAKIVGERLRASVEALAIPHAASTCARVATITAGFASFKVLADSGDTIDRLIAAADAALLRAKTDGRNRVGGDAPLLRPSRVSAQRWQRYAPVHVDPWFADRIPAFLDEIRRETREVVQSARLAERRSGAALARLRASAENIGLGVIAGSLRDLDDAARTGDVEVIQAAADELVQYVTHVQVIYRRAPSALAG